MVVCGGPWRGSKTAVKQARPGPPRSSASAILIVAQTYKDFDRSGLSVDGTIFDYPTPSVYAINVNSLAKAHAKGQLLADLQFYQISIAIVPRKI